MKGGTADRWCCA